MSDLISRSALIMRLNDYALQVAPFRDMKSTWQYDAVQECIKAVEEQLTVEPAADVPDIYVGNKWIPVSERLPDEHDSIFAKAKGTDKWNNAMFEKISDEVNVTYEYPDGTRKAGTSHTLDGKWHSEKTGIKKKVVAWQPLPEPYKGE